MHFTLRSLAGAPAATTLTLDRPHPTVGDLFDAAAAAVGHSTPLALAFPSTTTTPSTPTRLHPSTADRAAPLASLGLAPGAALTALPLAALPLRGGLMVKVKTLTGKEIEVDIEPTDSIARIKERVEEKEGIPPVQQRLIFAGKQMADEKAAREYGVEGGSVLHLVLALRGGGGR